MFKGELLYILSSRRRNDVGRYRTYPRTGLSTQKVNEGRGARDEDVPLRSFGKIFNGCKGETNRIGGKKCGKIQNERVNRRRRRRR